MDNQYFFSNYLDLIYSDDDDDFFLDYDADDEYEFF